jgi:hypothetical protein
MCCLAVIVVVILYLKKKNCTFCFAFIRNGGEVITYGIRAGFNSRIGNTMAFVNMIFDYNVVK